MDLSIFPPEDAFFFLEEEEEEDFDFAYLERFETFLKSSLASDSSAKEKPIKQESPSKEWKKVRSWLYWKPS
jgi:hypothetical protein